MSMAVDLDGGQVKFVHLRVSVIYCFHFVVYALIRSQVAPFK